MTKFIMRREDKKTERDRIEDSPIIEETSEVSGNAKTTSPTVTTKEPIFKHLEEEKPISVRTRIKEFTAKLSVAHPIPKQETHHPETAVMWEPKKGTELVEMARGEGNLV